MLLSPVFSGLSLPPSTHSVLVMTRIGFAAVSVAVTIAASLAGCASTASPPHVLSRSGSALATPSRGASPVGQPAQVSPAPCTAVALFDAAVRTEHINPKDPRYAPGGIAAGQATVISFKCVQGWAYGDVGRPFAGTQDGGTLFHQVGGEWREVTQLPEDAIQSGIESACIFNTKYGVPVSVVNQLAAWNTPCSTASPPGAASWTTYRSYFNQLFHFKVDVPTALTQEVPIDPTAGPGTTGLVGMNFFSPGRTVELSVHGEENAASETPQQLQAKAESQWSANGGRVTYSPTLAGGFVVSGLTSGGFIFYERDFVFSKVVYVMLWIYPSSMKAQLDAAVTHSFATFSPGQT